MSINKEGYLSNEMLKIEEDIYNQNREYFELAKGINKLCHSLKFRLNIHQQDAQEITVATLFVSLLESFNSLYILLSKGLVNDSNVLLRSILEKTLRLKYVALSYDNAIHYHMAYEKERLKLMNAIINDQNGSFSKDVKKAITKKQVNEFREKIKSEKVKPLPSNEELAKKTGLTNIYQNAYRLLNDYVHTNASVVTMFVKSDTNGNITDLEWFSYFKDIAPDIKTTLFSTQYLVLSAIESTLDLFGIQEDEYEILANELNNLAVSFAEEQ